MRRRKIEEDEKRKMDEEKYGIIDDESEGREEDFDIYNMPLWRRMGADMFVELPMGGYVPTFEHERHAGKRKRD